MLEPDFSLFEQVEMALAVLQQLSSLVEAMTSVTILPPDYFKSVPGPPGTD